MPRPWSLLGLVSLLGLGLYIIGAVMGGEAPTLPAPASLGAGSLPPPNPVQVEPEEIRERFEVEAVEAVELQGSAAAIPVDQGPLHPDSIRETVDAYRGFAAAWADWEDAARQRLAAREEYLRDFLERKLSAQRFARAAELLVEGRYRTFLGRWPGGVFSAPDWTRVETKGRLMDGREVGVLVPIRLVGSPALQRVLAELREAPK